ncbi:steroid 5-alpha reductase family enzyme [Amorphus suaedae]
MPASHGTILLTTFLIAAVMFTLMWRIHVTLKDASVIDYYWAAGFVVIAAATALMAPPLGTLQVLFVVAIVVWAIRLTHYVVRRHRRARAEDGRYRRFRDQGGPTFWWKSLFSIFLLQAVLQWLIATPVIVALTAARAAPDVPLAAIGFGLFCIGLLIEAVADAQLAAHRAAPANAGTVLQTGLWAWSRHPNYFGEALLWWGLALVAFALSGSLWAFLGPAVLTVVVVVVSLRLTEDHVADTRAGFAAYKARTSAFVPWPPATAREG